MHGFVFMICIPLIYDEIMKYKSYHTVVYAYGIAIIFNIIQHLIFLDFVYIDINKASVRTLFCIFWVAESYRSIAVCYSLKWVNRCE